jgi:hypothetical protein
MARCRTGSERRAGRNGAGIYVSQAMPSCPADSIAGVRRYSAQGAPKHEGLVMTTGRTAALSSDGTGSEELDQGSCPPWGQGEPWYASQRMMSPERSRASSPEPSSKPKACNEPCNELGKYDLI